MIGLRRLQPNRRLVLLALAGVLVMAICLLTSLTLASAAPLPGPRVRTELYQLPTTSGCSYVFKVRSRFEEPQAWLPDAWGRNLGRLTADFHMWGQGSRYSMLIGAQANINPPLVNFRCP